METTTLVLSPGLSDNRAQACKLSAVTQRACLWQRPYHVECTGSRQITEVKQRWAWIVLGWETAWEHQVLLAFFNSLAIIHALFNLLLE
jgi:hypothetical protein